MISCEKMTEILNSVFDTIRHSKVGAGSTEKDILKSPVFNSLVGYMISETDSARKPMQLNG